MPMRRRRKLGQFPARSKALPARGPATLVDKVTDSLRESIIDGTLAPGEHLNQSAVSSRLGVSPIPLREAVRQLEAEGYLKTCPFKGAVVASVSAAEAEEMIHIAVALEGKALRLAFPDLTVQDLAEAGRIAETIKDSPDMRTRYERIRSVMSIIYGAHRRPLLFNLICRNRRAARRFSDLIVTRLVPLSENPKAFHTEAYAEVVELLKRGDVEGAVVRVSDRLYTGFQIVSSVFGVETPTQSAAGSTD
jgi:DNA-binding GntR family transcriptional regulator